MLTLVLFAAICADDKLGDPEPVKPAAEAVTPHRDNSAEIAELTTAVKRLAAKVDAIDEREAKAAAATLTCAGSCRGNCSGDCGNKGCACLAKKKQTAPPTPERIYIMKDKFGKEWSSEGSDLATLRKHIRKRNALPDPQTRRDPVRFQRPVGRIENGQYIDFAVQPQAFVAQPEAFIPQPQMSYAQPSYAGGGYGGGIPLNCGPGGLS